MEQSEANPPQEQLEGLALDSLKARSLTVLAQVKNEVQEEKVDKKTPITDRAVENFHFIERLRQMPPVQVFLERTDAVVGLFEAGIFDRTLMEVDRLGTRVSYMNTHGSFEWARDKTRLVSVQFLNETWERGGRHWIKKLGSVRKIDIIEKFEKTIHHPVAYGPSRFRPL